MEKTCKSCIHCQQKEGSPQSSPGGVLQVHTFVCTNSLSYNFGNEMAKVVNLHTGKAIDVRGDITCEKWKGEPPPDLRNAKA